MSAVGQRWLDFSGFQLDPADARRNGAAGVTIYLSAPVPATAWKRRDRAFVQACIKAGLDVMLNFEWYETRALEGFAAGVQDGTWARAQAMTVGYPLGRVIVFSHDTSSYNRSAIGEYLRGVAVGLRGAYEVGIYGGYQVVEDMVGWRAVMGWQTLAWSNGRISAKASLYQNGRQWYHGQVDEDVVRRPHFGSWLDPLAGSEPAPTPTPKPGPTPAPAPAPAPRHIATQTYTAAAGDTLTSIAGRFHSTWQQLAAMNHLANPDVLAVGQKLTVPVVSAAPAPKPAPKPVAKPVTPPAAKPAPPARSIPPFPTHSSQQTVIQAFQREHHLVPDGIIGPLTWKAMWSA